jgi:hypothetical protein
MTLFPLNPFDPAAASSRLPSNALRIALGA